MLHALRSIFTSAHNLQFSPSRHHHEATSSTQRTTSMAEILSRGSASSRVSTGSPTPSARDRFFGVYELLELVLVRLSPLELFIAQRVSRQFRHVIQGSSVVAKAMFLLPEREENDLSKVAEAVGLVFAHGQPKFFDADWIWNPLLRPLFCDRFEEMTTTDWSVAEARLVQETFSYQDEKLLDPFKPQRKGALQKLHVQKPIPLKDHDILVTRLCAALHMRIFLTQHNGDQVPVLHFHPDWLTSVRFVLQELPPHFSQMYVARTATPFFVLSEYKAAKIDNRFGATYMKQRRVLLRPCNVGDMIRIAMKMTVRDETLSRYRIRGKDRKETLQDWSKNNLVPRWTETDGFTAEERMLMMTEIEEARSMSRSTMPANPVWHGIGVRPVI